MSRPLAASTPRAGAAGRDGSPSCRGSSTGHRATARATTLALPFAAFPLGTSAIVGRIFGIRNAILGVMLWEARKDLVL